MAAIVSEWWVRCLRLYLCDAEDWGGIRAWRTWLDSHIALPNSSSSYIIRYIIIWGIAYHWFKSYLCNRQQFTVINNVSSCFSYVPCGVPQESTLGPLLFLLYTNDISRVLPGENVKLFADDTNLFISGVDVNTLNQKCNYCIDTLNRWFVANRLHPLPLFSVTVSP